MTEPEAEGTLLDDADAAALAARGTPSPRTRSPSRAS